MGEIIWDAFPETVGSAFEENYRRARELAEEVSFECFFEPLCAWYEVHASPISSGGLGVWFRNINERRKQLAALTAAEERLRLAAKATRDLIFDWDIGSGRLQFQDSYDTFLGYARNDLGGDIEMFMALVHPDDRDRLRSDIRQAISGDGNHLVCDCRLASKDGRYADVIIRAFLARDEEGSATRLVGAVEDNTERNAAIRALRDREAHLSSVFGQAMVGIMHCAPDGHMLMVNRRFCEILGRSADELRGLDFTDFTHPEDLSWNVPLHRAKKAAGESFQIEKRYVRGDGSIVWCEVSVSFLRTDDGRPPSCIVVAQDISARKSAEEALGNQSDLLQTVVDSVQDLIFAKDCEGRFVLTNKALTDSCGDLLGIRTIDRFPAKFTDIYESVDEEVIRSGAPKTVEEIIPVGGRERFFETVKVPWVERGQTVGVIGVSRDITDNKANAIALRKSELLYRSVLEASADSIEILDLDGNIVIANSSSLAATDVRSLDQIRGKAWLANWPDSSREKAKDALAKARNGRVSRFSAYSQDSEQSLRWWDVVVSPMCDEDGSITGILSVSRDTTFQREASAKLKWASEHDELTGLPNRRAFQNHLQAATLRAMNSGGSIGLLLIDLDHFKHVNDTLGHTAGDHLLRIFGERLKQCSRVNDLIARLGGDEFAVLIEGPDDRIDLAGAGAAILSRLQEPVEFGGRALGISASLGGAVYPKDAMSANELFENADIALYALKGSGRGGTRMFEPSMRARTQIVSSQLSLARASIMDRTIEPYYQPKVDLRTGQIAGFEALLRWHHSSRGIQLPGSVAEAFKDYELASKISERIQQKVFADVKAWLTKDVAFGRVSINAAPVEFLRDDFSERMIDRMRALNVPPHLIELEVTENVFVESGSTFVERALQKLHEFGVKIALDDFGTGYSSLSHLRDFPVDVVKIDRSFVRGMIDNSEMMAIVSAVIHLAASLKIEAVAEGVETEDQMCLLAREGCPLGQGYFFGEAIEASQVAERLGRGPGWASSWVAARTIQA
ncbi:EAL domain-containing protein [Sphingosinicella sp. GR2756]|uniref:EAL domain-containing protein n=2 Tax=Sphingosinicella rhizophila TaxID=3050082 RepID=A0ABU3QB27_9SPHN|nr:EAL domain-containing protein [Sphingosinicella sp. GR2756]MDT9600605.1 EAL domain-containing protein [Sphingosinicella sp. GR2756]